MNHVHEIAKSNDYGAENVKELSEIRSEDVDLAKKIKEHYENASEETRKAMVEEFNRSVTEDMAQEEDFKSLMEDSKETSEITDDVVEDFNQVAFMKTLEKYPNVPASYRDALRAVERKSFNQQEIEEIMEQDKVIKNENADKKMAA